MGKAKYNKANKYEKKRTNMDDTNNIFKNMIVSTETAKTRKKIQNNVIQNNLAFTKNWSIHEPKGQEDTLFGAW